MLGVVMLKEVLHETNTIVSFLTYEGRRLDVSKKFIKPDKVAPHELIFVRPTLDPQCSDLNKVTWIRLHEYYVVDVKAGPDVGIQENGHAILMVRDIMSYSMITHIVDIATEYAKFNGKLL